MTPCVCQRKQIECDCELSLFAGQLVVTSETSFFKCCDGTMISAAEIEALSWTGPTLEIATKSGSVHSCDKSMLAAIETAIADTRRRRHGG